MQKISGFTVIVLLLWIGTQTSALGFDQGDMMMHGFASQGYLKSSDNNYLGNSKDGSYEFNEIGVNFMVPVTDDLRFGIQFFSRDQGEYGNNELIVDWALLDYNYSQYLGFRAGKVKMPFGMRNKSRDVDNIRTSVILNQAVYNEGMRGMIVAIYGFNLYGSLPLGSLGDMDYDLVVGTIDIEGTSAFAADFINRLKAKDPIIAALLPSTDLSDTSATVKHMEGGQLAWNTPLHGLSFNVTDVVGKYSADVGELTAETEIETFMSWSVKYDYGRLSLIAEWMFIEVLFDAKVYSQKAEMSGWYAECAYRLTDRIFLGAAYGEYYPDATDKDGNTLENGDMVPDYYAWQKDTTFSSKFNVNEYLCLKFEVHYIDGTGMTDITCYDKDETKKHWFLYAFKTSINF